MAFASGWREAVQPLDLLGAQLDAVGGGILLKRLRLQEARRLPLSDATSAEAVAYEVGYASASQFNREYVRLFGQPPRRDAERLRAAASR